MAASRFQVVSVVRSLRIPAPREPDVGVETLTATVSSTVAGSVQFEDGGADIGTPVIVSGGVASATTTLLPEIHRLNAVFTSTDPAFTGRHRQRCLMPSPLPLGRWRRRPRPGFSRAAHPRV
jgi:hypothetical protein